MDTLNKILEKIGLYDLFVLLFTGVIALSTTIFMNWQVFDLDIFGSITVEETFAFLLISYFVGLILHEVSSLLYKHIFYRGHKLLRKAVSKNRKWQPAFSKMERNLIKKKLLDMPSLSNGESANRKICWSAAYEYSKVRMTTSGAVAHNERDQYTAGVSRSLSLYFAIMAVAVFVKSLWDHTCEHWLYVAICILLMLLFHHRFLRYTYMRYIRTFRSFCFGTLDKKE